MLVVLLGVIAVALVVGWVVLSFVVKKKQGAGADEARDLLGGDDSIVVFDEKAVCRGTESGPFNTWVGMGSLGLNDQELVFVRWSPHDVLRIKRSDILSYVFTTEHLEREYKQPILQVTFTSPEHTDGGTSGQDLVAWVVDDQDAWNDALKG